MNEMFERESDDFPNVGLFGVVSADKSTIKVIFPAEFIDASVLFLADNWGRHRVEIDPIYNGKRIVGFVDSDNIKKGKIDVLAAELNLVNLIPGKTSLWYAKQRKNDLLLGKFFTNLCENPEPKTPSLFKAEPHIRQVVIEKPITIDSAIDFINKWAADENATLFVENNMLAAEIRRVWGRKTG